MRGGSRSAGRGGGVCRTIRFTLSKPATVQVRFTRRGHTLKKRIRATAHAGSNRVRLSRAGRLRPGAYRLKMVATDTSGAHSKPARARFTAIAP